MTKLFKKNLSNKFPTKDITTDDIDNKLPLSTSKKKRIVKINNKIAFGEKKIPIIAGPNGVENYNLMYETAKILNIKNLFLEIINLIFLLFLFFKKSKRVTPLESNFA